MNVSIEADKEFMRLLRIEDPARYRNLVRNMEQAAARQQRSAGSCQNPKCSNTVLEFRAGTRFCSDTCRKQGSRVLAEQKVA